MSTLFFFFNDTATTEIYTLSLHDALPISTAAAGRRHQRVLLDGGQGRRAALPALPELRLLRASPLAEDRKSTRLNSSHSQISYAVFCLKKKKKTTTSHRTSSTDTSSLPTS